MRRFWCSRKDVGCSIFCEKTHESPETASKSCRGVWCSARYAFATGQVAKSVDRLVTARADVAETAADAVVADKGVTGVMTDDPPTESTSMCIADCGVGGICVGVVASGEAARRKASAASRIA